jgi:hypothetical protein
LIIGCASVVVESVCLAKVDGGETMAKTVDKLAKEIRELPDVNKMRLVDASSSPAWLLGRSNLNSHIPSRDLIESVRWTIVLTNPPRFAPRQRVF